MFHIWPRYYEPSLEWKWDGLQDLAYESMNSESIHLKGVKLGHLAQMSGETCVGVFPTCLLCTHDVWNGISGVHFLGNHSIELETNL